MTSAQFGGITFDDTTATGFHLSGLVGWDDGAPTRYQADERPQGNGSFRPGMVYRNARVVSVAGTWTGADLQSAYQARYQLAALPANESPFVVTDLLGSKTITAGLAAAPTMDDGLYAPFFSFAFDVVASDPFRYGDTVSLSTGVGSDSSGLTWPLGTAPSGLFFDWGTAGATGRVTTTNTGTADTYSLMEVTGGLSGGFQLTWVPTGAVVRFERPIDVASTVYLNPRTGRVSIDGNSDVTGFLTQSQWWRVKPGETGDIQLTPLGTVTGTPTLTARTAPAFV